MHMFEYTARNSFGFSARANVGNANIAKPSMQIRSDRIEPLLL
jgi:hypothetical protein